METRKSDPKVFWTGGTRLVIIDKPGLILVHGFGRIINSFQNTITEDELMDNI